MVALSSNSDVTKSGPPESPQMSVPLTLFGWAKVMLRAVVLGPHDPTWKKLYDALASLAAACGGTFAFVIDEGNGLWCVGLADSGATTSTTHEDRAADRFYEREMVPRLEQLRRGKRLEIAKTDGDDRYVAVSFAAIYVLVVWLDRELEPSFVRARIRRALPELEALTLSLPPSGGPSDDVAAGKVRA